MTSDPPLVGRDGALACLRAAIGRLAGGRGGAVWIEGGPGLGKTELLAHALRDVPARIEVRSGPPDRGRAAGDRPLLLVADDLHRAGAAAVARWSRLHRRVRTSALLLVTAVRPVPECDGAYARAAACGAETVRLGPLADGDATELACLLGHDPHVVGTAVRDAGGNPAYLRMLAHGRAAPAAPLRALVADHLSTLPRRAREMLVLLAAAPAGITAAELAARTHRPVPEVRAAMHEAVDGAILTSAGGVVRFRHPIVRRVLRMPVTPS
ncbi:hypothetical protein [Actinoplanes couchii]|nr:hypothetical protein [Actinoplanes couchii]MDR6321325.1 hypothetical protein [Actinoplanes couchii]